MSHALAQPKALHNLDSEIATLLYLLHTEAICQFQKPSSRAASNIHHLLAAVLNRQELSDLLRLTCEDIQDTWSFALKNSLRPAKVNA